jgi:hypothetical protein
MDLLTRGAGFGYLGSTITSLIYAVFTFIFFALEAAIMALALQMVVDWPLQWCYVLSSVVVLPLAMRGITLISRLQAWTQPLWLFLLLLPFVWIGLAQPQLYRDFSSLSGLGSGSSGFDPLMFGAAAAGHLLAGGADRRAGRLPALPARTHGGQPLALVGRGAGGRPGLGRSWACSRWPAAPSSPSPRCSSRSTCAPRRRTDADVPGRLHPGRGARDWPWR